MLSSTRSRRALAAAAVLASALGSQATAATPSVRAGQYVSDLASLPAASAGQGYVAPGSDALSPAAVDAARLALGTPGYRSAALHRSGSTLTATLVYVADGAREGVVVERTGTVAGDRVSFAPGAVVTGTARGADAVGCSPVCLTYATLSPKHQIVNGQGYGPGVYQVNLFLDGSPTIPAARSITVPFATCSAYQCETIINYGPTTGTTRHAFAPLGCDQSQTVWGTIKYDTGWKNDSATVQIDNPGC